MLGEPTKGRAVIASHLLVGESTNFLYDYLFDFYLDQTLVPYHRTRVARGGC